MLFYQSAAPTGWTKVTTQTDKVLRVTSGSGGVAGGTIAFSTVFGRTATDTFTLATANLPSHQHTIAADASVMILYTGAVGSYEFVAGSQQRNQAINYQTGLSGGAIAHSHPIDLRVQYVDIILASKN